MLFLTLSAEPRISESYTEIYNLIFFFAFCDASKGFMKVFKAFIKPSEVPQRSVKI